MNHKIRLFLAANLLPLLFLLVVPVQAAPIPDIYLPFTANGQAPYTSPPGQVVNLPYFSDSDILASRFAEMAIAWFGAVGTGDNYTDVRMAYNDSELVFYAVSIDRINTQMPLGGDLTQWDTAAISLQTSSADSSQPGSNAYRFLVTLRWADPCQTDSRYQATYHGNGSAWVSQAVAFTNTCGYMGSPGTDSTGKGWAASFHIPYSSLGLSGKPADGAIWRLHMQVYDRDAQAGPALGSKGWPSNASATTPGSWGRLRFGLPTYTRPTSVTNLTTVTLRDNVNGITILDGMVGGGSDCGGAAAGDNYYPDWGLLNYNSRGDFNIQNQGLIADWPCFSRYYITIPLNSLPSGKLIRSAKLTLAQMGGSDPSQAIGSWIQVFSVSQDWTKASINWNNAPQAKENISSTWVAVFNPNWKDPDIWSKLPKYDWDVSRAAADAYAQGVPLRLTLYSADKGCCGSGMHTGKYFVSSDTWSETNRPALTIEYVDP